jgi:hypothetical protein
MNSLQTSPANLVTQLGEDRSVAPQSPITLSFLMHSMKTWSTIPQIGLEEHSTMSSMYLKLLLRRFQNSIIARGTRGRRIYIRRRVHRELRWRLGGLAHTPVLLGMVKNQRPPEGRTRGTILRPLTHPPFVRAAL